MMAIKQMEIGGSQQEILRGLREKTEKLKSKYPPSLLKFGTNPLPTKDGYSAYIYCGTHRLWTATYDLDWNPK